MDTQTKTAWLELLPKVPAAFMHPFEIVGTLDEHATELEFLAFYAAASFWTAQTLIQGWPVIASLFFGAVFPFVTSTLWMFGKRLLRS